MAPDIEKAPFQGKKSYGGQRSGLGHVLMRIMRKSFVKICNDSSEATASNDAEKSPMQNLSEVVVKGKILIRF